MKTTMAKSFCHVILCNYSSPRPAVGKGLQILQMIEGAIKSHEYFESIIMRVHIIDGVTFSLSFFMRCQQQTIRKLFDTSMLIISVILARHAIIISDGYDESDVDLAQIVSMN
jgi:hypothetical protein